jgi:hypothetical protein
MRDEDTGLGLGARLRAADSLTTQVAARCLNDIRVVKMLKKVIVIMGSRD